MRAGVNVTLPQSLSAEVRVAEIVRELICESKLPFLGFLTGENRLVICLSAVEVVRVSNVVAFGGLSDTFADRLATMPPYEDRQWHGQFLSLIDLADEVKDEICARRFFFSCRSSNSIVIVEVLLARCHSFLTLDPELATVPTYTEARRILIDDARSKPGMRTPVLSTPSDGSDR